MENINITEEEYKQLRLNLEKDKMVLLYIQRYLEAEKLLFEIIEMPWHRRIFLKSKVIDYIKNLPIAKLLFVINYKYRNE